MNAELSSPQVIEAGKEKIVGLPDTKYCPKCKIDLPISFFNFTNKNVVQGGIKKIILVAQSYCKECKKQVGREYWHAKSTSQNIQPISHESEENYADTIGHNAADILAPQKQKLVAEQRGGGALFIKILDLPTTLLSKMPCWGNGISFTFKDARVIKNIWSLKLGNKEFTISNFTYKQDGDKHTYTLLHDFEFKDKIVIVQNGILKSLTINVIRS